MEGQLGLVEKGMRIVIDDKSPGFLGPKFEQIKLGVEGTGQDRRERPKSCEQRPAEYNKGRSEIWKTQRQTIKQNLKRNLLPRQVTCTPGRGGQLKRIHG